MKVRLINEYRDYYWHYADGEGWKYEFNSQPYLEQEQTLQLDGKGPTRSRCNWRRAGIGWRLRTVRAINPACG